MTQKAQGHPRETGTPLTVAQTKATIRTLEYVRSSMGDDAILAALSEFGSRVTAKIAHPHKLEDLAFTCERTSIYRTAMGSSRGRTPLIKGLYLWLSNGYYGNIYSIFESEEILKRVEPDIIQLRTAFAHPGGLAEPGNLAWKGRYELYRPYHEKPNQEVQIALLEIGIRSRSPFDCRFRSEASKNRIGRNQKFDGEGRIVPLTASSAMCILNVKPQPLAPPKGNFIIQLFGAESSGDDVDSVISCKGIMIAAVGNYPPSAWPLYLRRANLDFEPHVLSKDEYLDLEDDIKAQLNMGAVHWDSGDAQTGLRGFYTQMPPAP